MTADVAAAANSEIENDPLMPQIRVLADLGQAGDLRLFAEADAAGLFLAPAPEGLPAEPDRMGLSGDRGAAGQGRQLCRRHRCWTSPIRVLALPAYQGAGHARPIRRWCWA